MSVLASGFGQEIVWQRSLRPQALNETSLLRECAWVILSTGMRESVIRQKFDAIGKAFRDWVSLQEIVRCSEQCIASALMIFRNTRKIRAIATTAQIIHTKGFEIIRAEIASDPIVALQQFPHIGPVTSFHLAKNIGLPVAKPDRHLSRLAALCGYDRPSEFCEEIARYLGDAVPIVDIVLWRFATLDSNYLEAFLSPTTNRLD
jgi:hypothetical protein